MLNEILEEEIEKNKITLKTHSFRSNFNAITIGKTILLSSALENTAQKNAITAHELGHQYTCAQNLLDADEHIQNKYEYMADRWAAERVMPMEKLLSGFKRGLRTMDEFCDFLEIDEQFFCRSLSVFSKTYGERHIYNGYVFEFNPLNIKNL
ncbi:MAG: ImmA/IrrE family metallo-endopeptidase [Christensenella sp.]